MTQGFSVRVWPLSVCLLVTAVLCLGQEGTDTRLSTPRNTVDNFLKWQNPPNIDMEIAAEGFSISDAPLGRRQALAEQLKGVLDGRGLLVIIEDIPGEADFVDESTGLQSYLLFPVQLPEVSLTKVGERWLFSRATLSAIPRLYEETYSESAQALIRILPPAFDARFLGIALWQYLGVFLLILAGLLIRKIVEFFVDRLAHWLIKRTPPTWDERILFETIRPLALLVMLLVFYLSYVDLQLPVTVNAFIKLALEIAFAGAFMWLAFKLVDFVTDYLTRWTAKTESKLDDQLVPLLRKSLKVFTFVIIALAVVQSYGYSVSSLLAGLGIGGLAVALAAQDTLSNFFGSLTIFLDKPFQVGDWVIAEGIEGTVEEVGFRSSRIRTFYNSVVTVPNSRLANTGVDNMGLRRYRRIKEVLGLTYSTSSEQMQAFVEGIRAIIQANKHMRHDFYEIHFNGFGSSSLSVLVYCFLEVESWSDELREKHNFFLEILRLAEHLGVEFAFPTQTLHVDSFYRDQPRRVGREVSEGELAEAVVAFGPQGKLSRPHGPELRHDGAVVNYEVKHGPERGSE